MILHKIRNIIDIKNEDKIKINLINKGYYAKSYLLKINDDMYFVKEFKNENVFSKELDCLKKLSEISVSKISTPEIIASKDNIMITKFVNGNFFYGFLIRHRNRYAKIEKSFFALGKYLAKLHNTNFVKFEKNIPIANLHGDVTSKNMLFLENSDIFLMDPYPRQKSIYKEIARFICNFYPPNIIYGLLILKIRRRSIQSFVKGYLIDTNFELNEKDLRNAIIDMFNDQKKSMRDDLLYRIKKVFINLYVNFLIRNFNYDKLQIKLH